MFTIFPANCFAVLDRRSPRLELLDEWSDDRPMSDDRPPPRDYAAELVEARRAAIEALNALQRAASALGFNEGFLAGWDEGRKRLQQVMEEAQKQPRGVLSAHIDFVSQPPAKAALSSPRAADVVLQIITANPGIRGVEIVRAADEAGMPILERTVRTALYRMKRDGQIRNLEGRWFATALGSDQASSELGGANDP